MLLTRYRFLVEALRRDETVAQVARSIIVFRRQDGRWHSESDEELGKSPETMTLDQVMQIESPWRERNSKSVYFPIDNLEAVVVAEFSAPPQKNTISKFSKLINRSFESATDKYQATHDSLTGLTNRDSFDRWMNEEIGAMQPPPSPASAEMASATNLKSVSLVAIDVDNFKQVNDTHGHKFGDIVLCCLARRLDRICQTSRKMADRDAEILPARPSGEEFFVLVSGPNAEAIAVELAEAIRSEISLHPLPTENEYSHLPLALKLPTDAPMPNELDRRITVSIGVASIQAASSRRNLNEMVNRLKSQADISLYRAKYAGKNRTVLFKDIISRHGRVLEHHPETNVVAIDLGRIVEVKVGQEFLVFHPSFTGERPFLYQDGRTQKRLGTYPRVECGRVEVFEVQADISFCKVVSTQIVGLFASGAVLEPIPLGSVLHLVGSANTTVNRIPRRDDIDARVAEVCKADRTFFACAVSLSNADEISSNFGLSTVNRILAHIYEALKDVLPRTAIVAQIAPTEFAALVSGETDKNDVSLKAILERVEQDTPSIASVKVGAFTSVDAKNFQSTNKQQLDLNGAVQFCQYAALSAEMPDEKIMHFSQWCPAQIIYLSRTAGEVDKALRDYENLSSLGAGTVEALNQLALVYWEKGKIEQAAPYIRRAVEMNPEEPMIWLNAAVVMQIIRDEIEGLGYFRQWRKLANAPDQVTPANFQEPQVYFPHIALLHAGAYLQGNKSVQLEEARELLMAAKQMKDIPPKTQTAIRNNLELIKVSQTIVD